MSTFFVTPDSVTPPTIRVTGDLLHHLRDSLRVQPGDTLALSDGRGTRYRVEVILVTLQAIESRIVAQQTEPERKTPSIVLGQALIKGDKMDWVIQKATELGADAIIPLQSIHSVVKLNPERFEHQRSRWERIARDAAQQSERWTIPTIANPASLAQICRQYASSPVKGMLAERSSGLSLATLPLAQDRHSPIVLLIGPEGGWTPEEQSLAQEQGFLPLTLGPRILRAETATIAALSILQSRLDEMR